MFPLSSGTFHPLPVSLLSGLRQHDGPFRYRKIGPCASALGPFSLSTTPLDGQFMILRTPPPLPRRFLRPKAAPFPECPRYSTLLWKLLSLSDCIIRSPLLFYTTVFFFFSIFGFLHRIPPSYNSRAQSGGIDIPLTVVCLFSLGISPFFEFAFSSFSIGAPLYRPSDSARAHFLPLPPRP